MRSLLTALMLFAAIQANASASYTCVDPEGNTAELTILNKKTVTWNEPWHSASSNGVFAGRENAPYSDQKGYFRFRMTDFYTTDDSAFYVALSAMSGSELFAITYFDNDDHYEQETVFTCTKL